MTLGEAKKAIKKAVPNCKILKSGSYKDGYLFLAPDAKLGDMDFNNPYYYVDSKGAVSKFAVQTDFDGVRKALM